MSDLLTCTHCKRDKHYTEYNKAGWGRLAADGTKRHQLCKVCKKYKHQLSNPVRFWDQGKFISPNNKRHPFHDEYKQGGYKAVFSAMGLEFPKFDPDAVAPKTLASNTCNEWLDYLEIPQENREVRVGKYQVDALHEGIVYEFYGTYYHADPRYYDAFDMIFKKTAAEVWKKDEWRMKYILAVTKSQDSIIMWESDWRDFIHQKGLQNEN
jgi:hypothetical protein